MDKDKLYTDYFFRCLSEFTLPSVDISNEGNDFSLFGGDIFWFDSYQISVINNKDDLITFDIKY